MRNVLRIFFILLAVFVTGLSSCTSDRITADPVPDEEGAAGRQYFSLRVRTSENNELDADVYADGTAFEHAVDLSGKSEHAIIFFDADWKYYGYSLLEFDRMSAQGSTSENYPHEAAYIGFLRPSDTHEIYAMPEYGVLVLNAFHISEALDKVAENRSAGIGDVLELVDTSTGTHAAGRSGNYFTMTSSAYLVKDSGQWRHSIVFRIDKTKIFDNRAQAVVSPAATAIVERMCAKFSLYLDGTVGGKGVNYRPDGGRAQVIVCEYIDGQPNYSNRTWDCSVAAWGINKFEPGSYYFRNIVGETADVSAYPYTYGEDINTTGRPFFNGWNQSSFHRAKWAVDPNYSSGTYPAQFRPAVDNPQVNYFGRQGEPSLGYLSFNELSTDFSGLETADGCMTLYSSENTFPDTRMAGLWQHDLAASEVVIGAQIHISRLDNTHPDYDLYRNRIGVFYPSAADFAQYFISTINTQLASQSNMTYRYYDWTDPDKNKGAEMRTFKVNHNDYKLYYLDKPLTAEVMARLSRYTIPANIENGDGKVIPWVQGMYIGRRAKDPDTYEEIGDIQRLDMEDANAFKSLIYDWVGAFDHYSKGRMVYSVPIRYRASKEKVESSGYKPVVGDYGVVRNAWYSFVIDAINGLGMPVDDPDQKIIPYEASLENSIQMEINVLDWHRFSTEVTLPDHVK